MIHWVKSNCEILPCNAALNFNREERNKLSEILGKSLSDTILVCSEPGKLLYSDDCASRRIVKIGYNIDGVWTQGILNECLKEGNIDEENYNKAVVKLLQFGYGITNYNADTIIAAAKESKWVPLNPYTSIINFITQENKHEDSSEIFKHRNPLILYQKTLEEIETKVVLVKVLTAFIFKLSKQSISIDQEKSLISYLISQIASRNDGELIINLLIMNRLAILNKNK